MYSDAQLVRQDITPEIMRSSLEHVILQLGKLKRDPLKFPFMDSPRPELLTAGIDLLKRLGCLDKRSGAITEDGLLASTLDADPRLVYFVLRAHRDYDRASMAAGIVAILSAPGSVFFLGGGNKTQRQSAKERLAALAQGHDSDLLFLHSVYQGWVAAGNKRTNQGACAACGRWLRSHDRASGCKFCRKKYCIEHGLNNKTLSVAHNSAAIICNAVLSARSRRGPIPPPRAGRIEVAAAAVSDHDVVSQCLVSAYEDQVAEVLVRSDVSAGVHLLKSGLCGRLNDTSGLAQSAASDFQFALVMKVLQLPGGDLIVEQVHPLAPKHVPAVCATQSVDMVLCCSANNLSPRYFSHVQRHFREATSRRGDIGAGTGAGAGSLGAGARNQALDFVYVAHDASASTLKVYGPKGKRDAIKKETQGVVLAKMQEDCTNTVGVPSCNNTAFSRVAAGLKVARVHAVEAGSTVRFAGLPPQEEEARAWVHACVDDPASDIVNCHIVQRQGGRRSAAAGPRSAFVTFKDAATARLAVRTSAELRDGGSDDDDGASVCSSTSRATTASWATAVSRSSRTSAGSRGSTGSGAALHVTAEISISRERQVGRQVTVRVNSQVASIAELHTQLGLEAAFAAGLVEDKVRYRQGGSCKLKLRNIPPSIETSDLRRAAPHAEFANLYPAKHGVRKGVMSFPSVAECQHAQQCLQAQRWATVPVPASLPQGLAMVVPTFVVDSTGASSATTTLVATFDSSASADAYHARLAPCHVTADGYAQVAVQHSSLFTGQYSLERMRGVVEARFKVQVGGAGVVNHAVNTHKHAGACASLRVAIVPTVRHATGKAAAAAAFLRIT